MTIIQKDFIVSSDGEGRIACKFDDGSVWEYSPIRNSWSEAEMSTDYLEKNFANNSSKITLIEQLGGLKK